MQRLIGKDAGAGKDRWQKEKGAAEGPQEKQKQKGKMAV